MSFQSIKRLIPQAIRSHGISKQIQSRQVLEASIAVLKRLWGEEKVKYILPLSFREGTLKLESVSGPAMQQLKVDQIRFLNELNRQLGERVVLNLEIRSKGF